MSRRFRAVALVVVLGFVPSHVFAQYAYRDHDKDGEVVAITYQGDSEWLVEQKDPKSHFHKLPSLKALSLIHHGVSYEEMEYVSRLKGLTHLHLGIGPESLQIDRRSFALVGRMKQLEGVSLCIDGDDHLESLTKLERLNYLDIKKMSSVFRNGKELVFERGFTDAAAEHLVQLKSLDWLRLGNHAFSDAFIEKLAALPKLKRLEVASPRFTDKALSIIGEKYRLRVLGVSSDKFTDEGIRALSHAEGLEAVHISSPLLTAKAIPLLKPLRKLRELELSIGQINPDTMSTLAEMKSLEKLMLRSLPITDGDLAALKGHSSLHTLSLNGEKLTERSLDVFKSMPELNYVDLGVDKESTLQLALTVFLKAKQAHRGNESRAN